MPKKNEVGKKEIYRLWREYLGRSRDYRELCEFLACLNIKNREELLFYEYKNDSKVLVMLFTKFRGDSDKVFQIRDNFLFFENPYDENFEDWWKNTGLAIKIKGGDYKPFLTQYLSDTLHFDNKIHIGLTKPLRYAELRRYLKVYDLRTEGKKWREVAAEVYKKNIFDEDLRTILIKEKKKAEKILKNVEAGYFPGKY